MTDSHDSLTKRLADAYHTLMEQVHDKIEKEIHPKVSDAIEDSKEKMAELGELSKEEIDDVATYLKRDLKDAGEYLASNDSLTDWLKFDVALIENELWQRLTSLADKTRLELDQWTESGSHYHTGHITSPGTLICRNCGKQLHFTRPSHVPPCPGCRGTDFKREAS